MIEVMLPSKEHPLWKKVVENPDGVSFKCLPTQMLMMRIRMLQIEATPQRRQEALDLVYEFFSKNETAVETDIQILTERFLKDEL